jgi:hypothetical protein
MDNVIEVESTVVCETAPVFTAPEPWTPERLEAKERIRLAFIAGKATLAFLASQERLPIDTVQRWSSNESWGAQKCEIQQRADGRLTDDISDFLAKERTKQVKRAITRASKLQQCADKIIHDESGEVRRLDASELQALSTAEERADNIIRRNLGMDQQNGGNSGTTVNILAGNISLA